MKVDLRAATPEDQPFLAELDAEVRAADFAGAALPPAALTQLLAMQHRAQTMGYTAQFPAAESSVVWIGPHRIGRLLVNAAADELRVVDIALLGPYRGGGIGAGLLNTVAERAEAAGLPLRLSVRTGSPATRLYTRLGFAVTGGDGMYTHMELWTGQTASLAAEPEPAASSLKVPPATSSAYFRSLVGTSVQARGPEGACVDLHVTSLAMKHSSQPQVDVNDSFTVSFTGPAAPVFSGMCELREQDADPQDEGLLLFLVPLGPLEDVMQYEAVFNRMQWKPKVAPAAA